MKIICPKSQFLHGVNIVSKAVSTKTTMDILECILIEAYDGCIKLTANDTEPLQAILFNLVKSLWKQNFFLKLSKKFRITT